MGYTLLPTTTGNFQRVVSIKILNSNTKQNDTGSREYVYVVLRHINQRDTEENHDEHHAMVILYTMNTTTSFCVIHNAQFSPQSSADQQLRTHECLTAQIYDRHLHKRPMNTTIPSINT